MTKKLLKSQKSTKINKRLVALKMKNQMIPNRDIVTILDVHIDTITNWCKIYLILCLIGFCELHLKNKKISKFDKHILDLKKLFCVKLIIIVI